MNPVDSNQKNLDSTQYSSESIQLYEAVYGEDFVSPGGYDVAVDLIKQLDLPPGSKVLDAGCGLGGSAFVMATEFGLMVDGIDLSNNMLEIATGKLRARHLDQRVNLQHGDCLQLDGRDCYDAIYSRDVFLHIEDKSRLFSVLYSLLKPNGKLLFTDYCCGEKPWTKTFSDYVQDRGYCLHTLADYCALMRDSGFVNIESNNLSARFVEILQSDLQKIKTLNLSDNNRDKLRQSWEGKLERARSGDHQWGLFTASKVI